jgi:dTDP-4-dehydrorhamnose 3,5-epimerase-like enzyme
VAHGYRPLTVPCGLFYVVTRCFDLSDPDEYRVPWDHPSVRDLWAIKNE